MTKKLEPRYVLRLTEGDMLNVIDALRDARIARLHNQDDLPAANYAILLAEVQNQKEDQDDEEAAADDVIKSGVIPVTVVKAKPPSAGFPVPKVGDRVKLPGGVTAKVWSIDVEAKRATIGMGQRTDFGSYPFAVLKWSGRDACWKILKRDF